MTGRTYPFGRHSLLEALATELDPARDAMRLATERYDDLGRWMKQRAAGAGYDIEVYPQGSRNLGTTNRNPFTDEFDIDLVFRVEVRKQHITQRELNDLVRGWLERYVSSRQQVSHPLAPDYLESGKRAWTLHYPQFHLDILPVVPDLDGELLPRDADPSWLTDKQLTRWQATNPRGFAEWFRSISAAEFIAKRRDLAAERKVDVEELPDDDVKTTLQRTVQLLKRHRDYAFRSDTSKVAPPSALVTVLAANAYRSRTPAGGPLGEVLPVVAADLVNHLEHRDGNLWIPNPRCRRENYADRYAGQQDKEDALAWWLGRVREDIGNVVAARQTQEVAKAIDVGFGEFLGGRAARRVGQDTQQLREVGALGSTSSGRLRVDRVQPHAGHRFYGDPST